MSHSAARTPAAEFTTAVSCHICPLLPSRCNIQDICGLTTPERRIRTTLTFIYRHLCPQYCWRSRSSLSTPPILQLSRQLPRVQAAKTAPVQSSPSIAARVSLSRSPAPPHGPAALRSVASALDSRVLKSRPARRRCAHPSSHPVARLAELLSCRCCRAGSRHWARAQHAQLFSARLDRVCACMYTHVGCGVSLRPLADDLACGGSISLSDLVRLSRFFVASASAALSPAGPSTPPLFLRIYPTYPQFGDPRADTCLS